MKAAAIVSAFVIALAAVVVAAEEAAKPVEPFNGKDLTGWKCRSSDPARNMWKVGAATLDPNNPKAVIVAPLGHDLINSKEHSTDLYTEQEFGSVRLTCEVLVPKGANSGIYLQGRYEVQVLDSYPKDKDFSPGDMGGIYSQTAPKNAKYLKPGEWNTFDITFQAPKFDAEGKKTANATFVKVVLNGVTIHENVEAPKPTGGELGKEVAKGPLMLQGDHGAVAFRNIELTPMP